MEHSTVGDIAVSATALHNKLDRMETSLPAEMVRNRFRKPSR